MINKNYKQFVYSLISVFFTVINIIQAQSAQDLQQLKIDYEKFKSQNTQKDMIAKDINVLDQNIGAPEEATIIPYTSYLQDLKKIESKHFGYDFFTVRDTVSFWENLPIPSNYILGPGDELVISLWGQTQLRESYTISREGKIYDEKVGLLNLNGRTIEQARAYLKNQFGRVYSTLNGKNPSAYIDVSLGDLRSINVNFVGNLNYPGIYPIHPFSTVITGLIQAGGIDTLGSLRNIEIKRNSNIVNKIDLYDYFIKGESSNSAQLRDGDIVVINPRNSIISIDSAVVRPGLYESKSGESIKDMILYAGGPAYNASNKVGIKTLLPFDRRLNGILYNTSYVSYEDSDLKLVNKNDHVIVEKIFDETLEVEVIGQVKKPGKFYFYPGMTLKDLIDLSGGFEDSTFFKSVYQLRGELVRRNPLKRYETVFNVNIKEIVDGKSSQKIFLQNLDRFVVHANLNYYEKENILILGEVKIPGSYPITSDKETLEALLARAGGVTNKSLENGISIYRYKKYFESNLSKSANFNDSVINNDILPGFDDETPEITVQNKEELRLRVGWQNKNIILMPGDSIIIKEKTNTIFISGAVYNPGVLEYRKGKSIRYYLNVAGGITDLGNRNGIIVLYPNGVVMPKKWYRSPKIIDGSTILVNQKPIQEPFNITQFATNWTSIISSMITAIILAKQLNT